MMVKPIVWKYGEVCKPKFIFFGCSSSGTSRELSVLFTVNSGRALCSNLVVVFFFKLRTLTLRQARWLQSSLDITGCSCWRIKFSKAARFCPLFTSAEVTSVAEKKLHSAGLELSSKLLPFLTFAELFNCRNSPELHSSSISYAHPEKSGLHLRWLMEFYLTSQIKLLPCCH